MNARLPTGELTGPTSELGLGGVNPAINRLGLLAGNFTLQYAHEEDFSQYRLTFDNPPLSPEATLDLLYAPLHIRSWDASATLHALRRMLNPGSMLQRDSLKVAGEGPASTAALYPHISALMDILDSTETVAWRRANVPVYDKSGAETEVYRLLENIAPVDMNNFCHQAGDVPEYPYKRLKQMPKPIQKEQTGHYLRALIPSHREALWDVVRTSHFATFTVSKAKPATVYIPKDALLQHDLRPAEIFEVEVYGPPEPSQSGAPEGRKAPASPLRQVCFRTTSTFYAGRPKITWTKSAAEGRNFWLEKPDKEPDALGTQEIITDSLLGTFVVGGLAHSLKLEACRRTFTPPKAAAALTRILTTRETADEILGDCPLTLRLEALADQSA